MESIISAYADRVLAATPSFGGFAGRLVWPAAQSVADDTVLPVLVWLASMLGVHPVISAAPLSAYFAPSLSVFDAVFVMQAYMTVRPQARLILFSSLACWCCGRIIQTADSDFVHGRNLCASGGLAVLGGGLWAGVYILSFPDRKDKKGGRVITNLPRN